LKANLGISDTQVGAALLLFSLGALIISPFSSYIMDRFPNGRTAYYSVIFQLCSFLLPFLADSFPMFLLAMTIAGFANGFINITVNATAAIVEKHFQTRIMSQSHAMFSIGAIFGSIMAGFIADLGIPPLYHMAGVISILLIVNYTIRKTWINLPNISLKAPVFAFPNLALLGLFLIAICVVIAELTVMDWSAVYLKDSLQSSALISGLAFAGFSVSMAIGRLSSDAITSNIGTRSTLIFGCFLAGIGLGIAGLTKNPIIAILGFTICGLGLSVIVPLLFSLSATMKNTSTGLGIGSIATACVLAGLIGRPSVGWISDNMGMATCVLIAAGATIIAGVIGVIAAPRR
jgi:MFS family permease